MGSSSMESDDEGTYDYNYDDSDAAPDSDDGMSNDDDFGSQTEMQTTRRKVRLLE